MAAFGRAWSVARGHLARSSLRIHRYLLLTPLQLVLAGGGCMALAASSDLANTFNSPRSGGPFIALWLFLTLVAAFLLFLLACRIVLPTWLRRRRHVLRWLIYPVLLWSLFTAYQTSSIILRGMVSSLVTPVHYGSDDMYYNHYSAWLLLHGENPYRGPWLAGALKYFATTAYTPLARGRFANVRHYPTQAELDAVIERYLAHPPRCPPRWTQALRTVIPLGPSWSMCRRCGPVCPVLQ